MTFKKNIALIRLCQWQEEVVYGSQRIPATDKNHHHMVFAIKYSLKWFNSNIGRYD